jgi:hypothetical protein
MRPTHTYTAEVSKKTSISIEALRIGNWHSWSPKMIMILQSNGGLDRWLTREYADLVRQDKKSSPLEKFEKMEMDREAMGLIRCHVSEPLQKLTSNSKTTSELWEFLKTTCMIINPEAIEYLQKALWSIKLQNLEEVEEHIQRFNTIIQQLKDNNVDHQEEVLVSAALKSWPESLETEKKILQRTDALTLQKVEATLRSIAYKHMMQAATQELESTSTGIANAAIQDRRRRRGDHINIGRIANLKSYKELEEVPQEQIEVWEEHLNPDHPCRFGPRCWFKPTGHQNRPKIILKFLEDRNGRRGANQ